MAMNKRYMMTMKGSCSCSMPGVWRAVAHSEEAVVIYHSPKACGHVTREMDISGHFHRMIRQSFVAGQYTAPLITSNLREEHSIFGGADWLRQCIDHVMAEYAPGYIIIANSCVAGVIGDDTQAIAREAEEVWKIPVLAVPCSGFLDGEYYAGFYYGAKTLAQRFMKPQITQKNTVTLLGDYGGPSSPTAQELAVLLQAFDLKVNCCFPGYASRKQIEAISASTLCLPLGGRPQSYSWMRKLAADLQREYGVPFVDMDYPVGVTDTKKWLMLLGEMLKQPAAALAAAVEQEKRLKLPAGKCRAKLQGKRAVLCLGRTLQQMQLVWVFELLALAGMELAAVVLLTGLTAFQQEELQLEIRQHTAVPVWLEAEQEEVLHQADILLTTHEFSDDGKRQLLLPVLPPLGVGGLIQLMDKLARLADHRGGKGGLLCGW